MLVDPLFFPLISMADELVQSIRLAYCLASSASGQTLGKPDTPIDFTPANGLFIVEIPNVDTRPQMGLASRFAHSIASAAKYDELQVVGS